MKTSKLWKTLAVASAFLAIGLSSARADILTGEHDILLGGPAGVWDVSGTYYETLDVAGVDADVQYTLVQDADGMITGAGDFQMSVLGFPIDGDIEITGTIKRSGKTVRVQLTLLLIGSGSQAGATVDVSARGNLRAEIDELLRTIVGRMGVRVCATGENEQKRVRRCGSGGASFSSSLPDPFMDGVWNLSLNVINDDTGISGDAVANLANGDIINYSISGRNNVRKGTTSLLLTPNTGGATIELKNAAENDGSLDTGLVKGTVAGQKIKLKLK